MPQRRSRQNTLLISTAMVLWLGSTNLLQAAQSSLAVGTSGSSGGSGASGVSYATRFLSTDNLLGTSLIWLCFVISIAILAIIIQNFLTIRQAVFIPEACVRKLQKLLDEEKYQDAINYCAQHPSPFARSMHAALTHASRGYAAMEIALEEAADAIGNHKIRALVWLEMAGAAGPMIGLFGTVFGMILAFNQLVAAGGSPKAGELAGGIATALICTFWGLVVGIPGVISASLFRVRIEGLTAMTIEQGNVVLARFRPSFSESHLAGASGIKAQDSAGKPQSA